ncbi:Protein SENSITIVE TO PROTON RHIZOTOXICITY 1 [Ananas comosus]|uniref:Protein SENSITIVE TO PROTON RHIZOTOXICITY 1 n=1 Tax=Ananas comosus TaxID=4615 RepID=A0A199UV77_ANACO|nr:Protein SENSITIVE TO PROTON RHIZOTOXICITY 1 [Ananas comosus]
MIPGATAPYFQHNHQNFQMFDGIDELLPPSTGGHVDGQAQNLMYNLSVLKDKIQQLQTLVGFLVAPSPARPEPAAVAVSGAEVVIQEIIGAASSMMYAFQQAELGSLGTSRGAIREEEMSPHNNHVKSAYDGSSQATSEVIDHVLHNIDASGARKGLYTNVHEANYNCNNSIMSPATKAPHQRVNGSSSTKNSDKGNSTEHEAGGIVIVAGRGRPPGEIHANYCQVCGKGSSGTRTWRMHMRAHGDRVQDQLCTHQTPEGGNCGKGAAADCALPQREGTRPARGVQVELEATRKFRPLKSIILREESLQEKPLPQDVRLQPLQREAVSVLSDLRTPKKHCGDTKWLCSCGTTFSRKDKLMGPWRFFVGHAPCGLFWSSGEGRGEGFHGEYLIVKCNNNVPQRLHWMPRVRTGEVNPVVVTQKVGSEMDQQCTLAASECGTTGTQSDTLL